MSKESAKEFIEKLQSDGDFRHKLEKIETPEARREVVTEAGFDFTNEEMTEVQEELGMSGDDVEGQVIPFIAICVYTRHDKCDLMA